jgi:CRISPR/Cas system-associated exonuclease Cas4 (RecB family)
MERETAAWKRAVGFAQQTVIAFTPGRLAGEPVFLHPLADEITFDILPAESLVDEQGRWQLAERTLRLQPQEIQSPTPPESFTIRPNEIAPRRKFSYSQMSKLLACPFRWFMDDYLGLKKPSGLDLPTGSLLIGILAHKIVELLYKNSERLAPEDASTRAGELFEELVPKMAAELLEEGNALGKERIKHTLQRAIKELVQRINEQGLSVKATEKELNGDFPPCGFTGKADCYLEDAAGNAFVIDMKWSFSSKYNEMLHSHKALQLATYAWLLRPDDFNAQCAYFLFPKSELLYENGEDWQRIWNTAKELWSAKRDAMQGGQLALGDPKDKEQLVTPECTYCDYQTICKREK